MTLSFCSNDCVHSIHPDSKPEMTYARTCVKCFDLHIGICSNCWQAENDKAIKFLSRKAPLHTRHYLQPMVQATVDSWRPMPSFTLIIAIHENVLVQIWSSGLL